MIRYRWPRERWSVGEAASLDAPLLRRLRGAGPWHVSDVRGAGVVIAMVLAGWTAAGWSDWAPGLDGCEFQVATNPPGVEQLDPQRIPPDAERIDLACGERVWVLPARRAPRRLGLGGRDMGAATAYGVAAFDLSDRMDAGTHTTDDVLRVCFLALASVNRRLLPEVCIGLGLLADADIQPLLEAAWRVPKAPVGDATSSLPPAASTPAAPPV